MNFWELQQSQSELWLPAIYFTILRLRCLRNMQLTCQYCYVMESVTHIWKPDKESSGLTVCNLSTTDFSWSEELSVELGKPHLFEDFQ